MTRSALKSNGLATVLILSAGLVLSATATGAAIPERMPVPSALQLPFILKILGYDRQLAEKSGKELTMGVVFDSHSRASVAAKDEVVAVLEQLAGKTVKKLPFRYLAVDSREQGGLQSSMQRETMDVVYLAPGMSDSLPDVLRLADERDGGGRALMSAARRWSADRNAPAPPLAPRTGVL